MNALGLFGGKNYYGVLLLWDTMQLSQISVTAEPKCWRKGKKIHKLSWDLLPYPLQDTASTSVQFPCWRNCSEQTMLQNHCHAIVLENLVWVRNEEGKGEKKKHILQKYDIVELQEWFKSWPKRGISKEEHKIESLPLTQKPTLNPAETYPSQCRQFPKSPWQWKTFYIAPKLASREI